ncbi:NUDIX hydrolase [Proteiniclasticum sp. C24MP]|uniref:NUDIX hydrolase n=1 Tax=Proteiniclasticum sp. C24MP TaxID=3374101 RepID=UPI003753F5B8
MKFDLLLGMEQDEVGDRKVFHREAVRGLVRKEDKVLLIRTKNGDWKFPGGGIEEEESHEGALKREILEEAGLEIEHVRELVGKVVERRADKYESDTVFEMVSYYYLCDGAGEMGAQNLSGYEALLEFMPEWMQLSDAFFQNLSLFTDSFPDRWLERETEVMGILLTGEIL